MNAKAIFLLFLIILPLAYGELYTPDKSISADDYQFNRHASSGGGDYVIAFTPGDHEVLVATLAGEGAYQPRLRLFDPVEETYLAELPGIAGKETILTYTFGKERETPYYLLINNHGDGESYKGGLLLSTQDDAGQGTDAPKAFRQGLRVELGNYTGHLGHEDMKDQYILSLLEGETLTITLTPADDASMGITLVDASGFTKIEQRQTLSKGASLPATYFSQKDQDVYIGISGNVPYAFSFTSDSRNETTMPEPIPEPEPEPIVIQEPAPVTVIPEPIEEEGRPIWGLVVTILALLIIILSAAFKNKLTRAKQETSKERTAKKKATKKKGSKAK